jgi:D-sedoheptulose 7-phosphate isomerase
MKTQIKDYFKKINHAIESADLDHIDTLVRALQKAWINGNSVYLCGNGGSAGNAVHLSNDFLYGVGSKIGGGLRVEALSANIAVITCLANDLGYENIYSQQLTVKGKQGDILIILSGSGNSPSVVKALETANNLGMTTFAILGFSGGKCKEIAHYPIHFPSNDMQISEDLQMIVGHICMQWLYQNGKN